MRALSLVFLVALFGCGSAPRREPPYVAGEVAAARRILLAPPNLFTPPQAEYAAALPGVLPPVEAYLKRHGIAVARNAGFASVFQGEVARMGGLFDPHTGARSDAKAKAALRATMARIRETTPFDAVLVVEVVPRAAHLAGRYGEWDGVRLPVLVDGAPTADGSTFSGGMWGLSLRTVLISPASHRLYEAFGGIEFAEQIEKRGGEGRRVPATALLQSPDRLDAAADLALQPLVAAMGAVATR